jgi:ribosomal protein S12 methylthiotransferase
MRHGVPGLALRTTFIVGFPGETEDEFAHLCQSVEDLKFDRIGVFTYSDEEGTPAYDYRDRVPKRVKERRRRELMALARRVSREQNQRFMDARLQVLIEGTTVEGSQALLVGRSRRDAPEVDGLVLARGSAHVGNIVDVRVTGTLDYDLLGHVEEAA